ncbi:MAG: M48 family metalloprotease, partial [Burkholderiales bacterium]
MDFFAQQEAARRASRRLVLWYLLAVVFVVACFDLAATLLYAVFSWGQWMPLGGHLAVSGSVALIILAVTAQRLWRYAEGGTAVAALLNAHYLDRSRVAPAEAKLLNVVEEMAIASGIAVPPVYLLNHEDAVNALVAGHSPSEAVIIVTRGAVQKLSRDELQGVMGHEFSHILNGDMALNLRLASLLAGVACFGEWGEAMVHAGAREARGKAREEVGGEALAALFGAAI